MDGYIGWMDGYLSFAFICMVLGVHLGHRKYKITSFVRDDYVKFMTMCRMLVLCEIKFSSDQTIIHM